MQSLIHQEFIILQLFIIDNLVTISADDGFAFKDKGIWQCSPHDLTHRTHVIPGNPLPMLQLLFCNNREFVQNLMDILCLINQWLLVMDTVNNSGVDFRFSKRHRHPYSYLKKISFCFGNTIRKRFFQRNWHYDIHKLRHLLLLFFVLALQLAHRGIQFESQKHDVGVQPNVEQQNQQGADGTIQFVVR